MKRLIIWLLVIFIGIELGKVGFDALERHINNEVAEFHQKVEEKRNEHIN